MTWLHPYQTLIVGGLGFGGVILTLLFNAWQTRKLRREERNHERQTLRAALVEELKINRDGLASNIHDIRNNTRETGGYFVPTDSMDDAYRSFIHRIGLLSQTEVSKVMYAYLSLRTYDAKLFLIGLPVHTSERHVQVPIENGPMLAEMGASLLDRIDEAVGVMERARDAGSGRRWRIWPKVPRGTVRRLSIAMGRAAKEVREQIAGRFRQLRELIVRAARVQ